MFSFVFFLLESLAMRSLVWGSVSFLTAMLGISIEWWCWVGLRLTGHCFPAIGLWGLPQKMSWDFEDSAWGVWALEDVTSLWGDTLGIFPNLCGTDHKGMGEFLQYHYEGHFQDIFLPLLNFSRVESWGRGWQPTLHQIGTHRSSRFPEMHVSCEGRCFVCTLQNTALCSNTSWVVILLAKPQEIQKRQEFLKLQQVFTGTVVLGSPRKSLEVIRLMQNATCKCDLNVTSSSVRWPLRCLKAALLQLVSPPPFFGQTCLLSPTPTCIAMPFWLLIG